MLGEVADRIGLFFRSLARVLDTRQISCLANSLLDGFQIMRMLECYQDFSRAFYIQGFSLFAPSSLRRLPILEAVQLANQVLSFEPSGTTGFSSW